MTPDLIKHDIRSRLLGLYVLKTKIRNLKNINPYQEGVRDAIHAEINYLEGLFRAIGDHPANRSGSVMIDIKDDN